MNTNDFVIWWRRWENGQGWVTVGHVMQDIIDHGRRDGRDGILLHHCGNWDRTGLDDPSIYGDKRTAIAVYCESYRLGRKEWFLHCGSFPSSGYTGYDADIRHEIEHPEPVDA